MKKKKEEPISFRNENGKQLIGVLHLPEGEKPPAVIICHGFQNTKTERKYIKLARALREQGILVFRFDFEGCGDSEGRPRDITVEKEISDLKIALKTVLEKCDVNQDRIGFVGGSLGSVVVSLFAEKEKTAKTLVFWSQAFDQKKLFENWYSQEDIEKIEKETVIYKGEKEIGKDYYLENSNKDYSIILSKLNLPILIIHGEQDEDVPVEFSKRLAEKYKNITLEILDKANHKFNDFQSQQELIRITTEWFKKYL